MDYEELLCEKLDSIEDTIEDLRSTYGDIPQTESLQNDINVIRFELGVLLKSFESL